LQGIDEDFCHSSEAAARNPEINDEAIEEEQKRRLNLIIRLVIIKFTSTVRVSPKDLDLTNYVQLSWAK